MPHAQRTTSGEPSWKAFSSRERSIFSLAGTSAPGIRSNGDLAPTVVSRGCLAAAGFSRCTGNGIPFGLADHLGHIGDTLRQQLFIEGAQVVAGAAEQAGVHRQDVGLVGDGRRVVNAVSVHLNLPWYFS